MGTGLMALALLAQWEAPLLQPLSSPQLLELAPASAATDAPVCTPDGRICMAIVPPAEGAAADASATLVVTERPDGLHGEGGSIPVPAIAQDGTALDLWPHAIRLSGNPEDAEGNYSLLIGFVSTITTAYSGGGGQARRLHLHRLRVGVGVARLEPELLSVPLSGSLMIRACFAENDMERRRGACHDEYRFDGILQLASDDDRADELPMLRFTTVATAFPQTARRWEDSSTAPPLRTQDMSTWRDPECSYTRTLRYNPATERYEMDRPAPDCSAYTVP